MDNFKVTEEIQDVLKKHVNDLANSDLDPIYDDCGNKVELTIVLLKGCGLDKLLKGVTKIHPFMFSAAISDELGHDCKTINIPKNITEISDYAFTNNWELKYITIPGTVKKIDKQAFYGCIHLETVNIEEGVQEIGELAFEFCPNLKDIYFPKSLNKFPSTLVSKEDHTESIEKFHIPKESYEKYKSQWDQIIEDADLKESQIDIF